MLFCVLNFSAPMVLSLFLQDGFCVVYKLMSLRTFRLSVQTPVPWEIILVMLLMHQFALLNLFQCVILSQLLLVHAVCVKGLIRPCSDMDDHFYSCPGVLRSLFSLGIEDTFSLPMWNQTRVRTVSGLTWKFSTIHTALPASALDQVWPFLWNSATNCFLPSWVHPQKCTVYLHYNYLRKCLHRHS